jgi:hypothetical protein
MFRSSVDLLLSFERSCVRDAAAFLPLPALDGQRVRH